MSQELDLRTQICGKYQHYKGNEYQVLGTTYHSETQELMVLYRPLYGDRALWVRPYDMFNEQVQVDGEMVARFGLIEEMSEDSLE